ncbi:MAG: cation:proton antiporter [Acetobacteraceae bacterium]|nr:cation:proton antiporter [Pseudomonadota bacterium]
MLIDTPNLIVVTLVVTGSAAIPALFPRLLLPGVVLELVLGALVGPQVLGWLQPGPTLAVLSNFGLVTLFLMAGFEIDPAVLAGPPIRRAWIGWVLSAVLAAAAAWLLTRAGLASAAALCGLALTTTAIGTLMPILRDSRLLRPPYGPMVLAGGAIGEAGPVVALALILAQNHAIQQSMIMAGFAACAFAAVLLVGRAREGRFARIVRRTMHSSGQLPMRLALSLMLLLAILAEELHIDLVLGGFVAGAIVRAALSLEHHEHIAARLDGLGSAFLIPIFFIISGARLDLHALVTHPAALAMVPVYALLMLLVRGLPVLLVYRDLLEPRQRMALALHLGTQISLVVAITGLAVRHELMPSEQAAAMVGGGILTTIIYPIAARRVLRT